MDTYHFAEVKATLNRRNLQNWTIAPSPQRSENYETEIRNTDGAAVFHLARYRGQWLPIQVLPNREWHWVAYNEQHTITIDPNRNPSEYFHDTPAAALDAALRQQAEAPNPASTHTLDNLRNRLEPHGLRVTYRPQHTRVGIVIPAYDIAKPSFQADIISNQKGLWTLLIDTPGWNRRTRREGINMDTAIAVIESWLRNPAQPPNLP